MKQQETQAQTISKRRFVSESVVEQVTGRRVKTLQKDRLFARGPFPHYKIGRQVLYDLDEVVSIIEASRVSPENAA